jgi:hypothetical protein
MKAMVIEAFEDTTLNWYGEQVNCFPYCGSVLQWILVT